MKINEIKEKAEAKKAERAAAREEKRAAYAALSPVEQAADKRDRNRTIAMCVIAGAAAASVGIALYQAKQNRDGSALVDCCCSPEQFATIDAMF